MEHSNGIMLLNSNQGISDNINRKVSSLNFYQINANGIKKVGLCSYVFVDRIPNVNIANHVGVIDTGFTSYPVQIPDGNYTETDLATAVQTVLTGLGLGVFAVTWNGLKFTITSPIPITIKRNPITGGKRDIFDMMGIEKEQPLSNSNISKFLVNLNYSECFYILSRRLMRSRAKVDFNTNYVTSNVGVVYRAEQTDKGINRHEERINNIKWISSVDIDNIDFIDIVIVDDEGFEIPVNDFEYRLEFLTY